MCQSLFLIKLQACNFIKKETLAQAFSCEFQEISQNTFSYRTPYGDRFCLYKQSSVRSCLEISFEFASKKNNVKILFNFQTFDWVSKTCLMSLFSISGSLFCYFMRQLQFLQITHNLQILRSYLVTAQKINFFIEDFFIFCTLCSMGSLAVEDCLLRSDFYKIY